MANKHQMNRKQDENTEQWTDICTIKLTYSKTKTTQVRQMDRKINGQTIGDWQLHILKNIQSTGGYLDKYCDRPIEGAEVQLNIESNIHINIKQDVRQKVRQIRRLMNIQIYR